MSPGSERDWRLYAEDIVEACGKVRRYVAGMTLEAFEADERTHGVDLIPADPLRGGPPRQCLGSRQEQFLRHPGQHQLRTGSLAISRPTRVRSRSLEPITRVLGQGSFRVIERS